MLAPNCRLRMGIVKILLYSMNTPKQLGF